MNIGYLISSCVGYAKPLQKLIRSMNVPTRDIAVAVGGHSRRSRHMILVWHTFVDHNSYDYTALIDYVENPNEYPDWTHVLLLHDTMQFGFNTERLVHNADPAKKATAVWGGECNLALYRVDYLLACKNQLVALRNCTKLAAVE